MVFFGTFAFAALSLLSTGQASSVQDLTPKNFDSSVFAGTPSLVEFFAPWCGHCKRLEPVYNELADTLSHASQKVNIAKVDGDAEKDLAGKYGIQGFPTLKWFDGKSKEPEDYNGGRDLESLQAFIQEKTGAKAKSAVKPPSQVQMLTDTTFKSAIGGDKDVLVAFTAPWCGHCKTLAPIWEQVAQDYSPDSDVVIAKVDAEVNKKVAEQQEVKGFPTIKFFPKNSDAPVDYSGGRDEPSFLSYVNEKAGTHRVAGGGLDAKAGTIDALDIIVAKLSGGNLESITVDAKKAAKGVKDKYAEYYVKVLDKIAANKAYLEKETGRLENMLKKGGLARPKEDDLTSRLNILKQFGLGEGEEPAPSNKEEL